MAEPKFKHKGELDTNRLNLALGLNLKSGPRLILSTGACAYT